MAVHHNIKMDLNEIWFDGVNWIQVVKDIAGYFKCNEPSYSGKGEEFFWPPERLFDSEEGLCFVYSGAVLFVSIKSIMSRRIPQELLNHSESMVYAMNCMFILFIHSAFSSTHKSVASSTCYCTIIQFAPPLWLNFSSFNNFLLIAEVRFLLVV
jgi:hypothetical protein